MITATLKQRVRRRRGRSQAPRFKLFVNGRLKAIWEKRLTRSKLVPSPDKPEPEKRESFWVRVWKKRRWVVYSGLALTGLVMTGVLFLCFSGDPLEPLPLPLEGQSLANPLSDPPEDEDVVDDLPPGALTLKNLKLTSYTVKTGDTIQKIADKHHLDLHSVISFNGIRDAHAVKKGTTLTLPSHRGLRYRVRRGDSLSRISQRFNVSIDDLLDWNNLSRSMITVGQGLFIPGGRLSAGELSRVMGTFFIYPARGRLTSGFGMRISPITGTRMHHNGIDIANRPLTPIHAAAAGRVAIVDYNPTYGNYIIIIHGNGFQTLYGHLKTIYVKKGSRVKQRQKIAGMGSTGASTGTHLHFSIFKNGRDVNPEKYLH